MSRSFSIISNFAAALAFAVPATAQAPVGASVPSSPDVSSAGAQVTASPKSPAPTRPVDRTQLRHQIYVMEGALARAVEFGAQSLNREMRSVMPDVFMLAGNAQARGVYLDGYGIFFDVQVPILRQSMMWSLRMMLDKDEAGVKIAARAARSAAGRQDVGAGSEPRLHGSGPARDHRRDDRLQRPHDHRRGRLADRRRARQ
ncbi:MAG: hypothetical protein LC791_00850 [Acidobacteria bacterium]|nr:hypothetical protein [Acidobacteriota bacterium]